MISSVIFRYSLVFQLAKKKKKRKIEWIFSEVRQEDQVYFTQKNKLLNWLPNILGEITINPLEILWNIFIVHMRQTEGQK